MATHTRAGSHRPANIIANVAVGSANAAAIDAIDTYLVPKNNPSHAATADRKTGTGNNVNVYPAAVPIPLPPWNFNHTG